MSDPFKIIEPTVIAFSGGRTSAYMLWRVLQSNNGKMPVSKPIDENCAKTPVPTAISTPGILERIPPNPIGMSSNGSNCLTIARYNNSNPIRIIKNCTKVI